jgi:hypothetical protein
MPTTTPTTSRTRTTTRLAAAGLVAAAAATTLSGCQMTNGQSTQNGTPNPPHQTGTAPANPGGDNRDLGG